jgi:DNA-binding NarL/FixJ family response regulator
VSIRVVLVDDMVELRALIRVTLERSERFVVVGNAGNGREAIDVVGATQPDLVLLDVSMPIMDGLEALPQLCAIAPATKVVILSGFSEARLGAEAASAGAAAYLEKGLAPDTLVARLLELVQRPD